MDIFAKEGIQVNDVNLTPPQVTTVGPTGGATGAPSGRPQQIEIPEIDKIQAAPSTDIEPPVNRNASDLAVTSDQPQTPPQNGGLDSLSSPTPRLPPPAPTDLFAKENVKPPSISEQNSNAFNNYVDTSKPALPGTESPGLFKGLTEAYHALTDYQKHEQEQVQQLAETRFTPEQLKAFKGNPMSWADATRMLDPIDAVPGARMVNQIGHTMAIKSIAERKAAGEEISVADQNTLNDFLDKTVEMNQRGFTWGGKIAYVGLQIPAFALEFAGSFGVGKMAQSATIKAAEELAIQGAIKSTIGVTSRVAAQTAVMVPEYSAKYGEMRLNDSVAVTDKGVLLSRESTQSPGKSALKAFGYTAAEVAGQLAAPVIGKAVLEPVSKFLGNAFRTPITAAASKLPVELRANLYDAYKAIQPNAKMSEMFSILGWSGAIEQLGANRVTDILHSTLDLATDKEYTIHDYLNNITPSADQLAVEGGLIGIAHGISTASHMTANILRSKGLGEAKVQETVDNMTANEKEQFVNDNLPTPKSSYPENKATSAPPEGVHYTDLDPTSDAFKAAKEIESQFGYDLQSTPKAPALEAEALHYENETDLAQLPPQDRAAVADGLPVENSKPEAEIVKNNVKNSEKAEPPPILDDESGFNSIYRSLWNELQPIHELGDIARARGAEVSPIEDPKLLSTIYAQNIEIARENLQVQTSVWDENGNRVVTGKSLKATMDDFDNMFMNKEPSRDQRKADFNDYLLAQRYLELKKVAEEKVTPDQVTEALATMANLADKYGKEMQMVEKLADEVYSFQGRILDNLVASGVMAPEMRKKLADLYPKYIPLQRVLEKETFAGSTKGPFTDARMSKVIKRLKGSDKEVKDVFHSIIANTVRLLDLAARNKVTQSITKLADTLPEYVQKVPAPIIKKGTAEIKVSYDPKLRAKLEATIEQLGGKLERMKSVKVKGYSNVMGSYDPMEKLIRQKIGTNEGTLAHEVGHMLDYQIGLKKKMLADPKVKAELQKLAEERLGGTIELVHGEEGLQFKEQREAAGGKYESYIKNDREVLANFFDAYVNSPEILSKLAPKAKAAFEKIIDADPNLAFIKDIKPSLNRTEETISKDVYGAADYAPPETLTVYNNGKKEYYKVSKPILEAASRLSPAKLSMTEKFFEGMFRLPTQMLRAGATLTPDFAIRNFLRDQHDAFLQSGVGYTPAGLAKGLFAAIGKNDLYHEWVRSGGKYSSLMSLDDKGIEKAYKELFRPEGKLMQYMKNPLRILADVSQTGEQATRLGVFAAAKKKGLSDIEASYASLEATINFARGGTLSKKVNKYIPFFNAGMQGVDKMIRTFKNNPGAVTFWGVATITIPQMILTGYTLYAADDKTRQAYLETPQWQKDMFFLIPVGDGELKRYPKPFTYGYTFGSVPENILNWMYAGNKPEGRAVWEETLRGFASSVSPINDPSAVIPPLMRVAIEDATNYDFFRGQPIYPDWMNSLTPEQRYKQFNTETSKLLGKNLGMSPALIDNTVQGLLGGTGRYGMQAGDKILNQVKEWNGEKIPAKPTSAADIPLIAAFAVRRPAGYLSNSYQNFAKTFDQVQQVRATSKKLEGKEQSDYIHENHAEISQYSALNAAHKEMRALGKQIDATYKNKSMSADDKSERINKLEDSITLIARKANLQYVKATRK